MKDFILVNLANTRKTRLSAEVDPALHALPPSKLYDIYLPPARTTRASVKMRCVLLHFADFSAGPGGDICRRLGVNIDKCTTWQAFTATMVLSNHGGALVDAARHLDGVASSGERAVLHAMLAAADFAWLADELSDGHTWRRLDHVYGDHRLAVAACLARAD